MAGTSNGGSLAHVHPVDAALGTGSVPPSTIYNAYVKSGDMSGAAATSFTSLVPFAENSADRVTLASHAGNTNAYLNGPGTSDQVTCFTCHRAHASAFPNALRWNGEYEMLTINGQYPGTNSTPTPNVRASRGRVIADYQAGYYDRPATVFATYQRSLCNKCHAND
jgi:predicted CXXCH cytochrome family protein